MISAFLFSSRRNIYIAISNSFRNIHFFLLPMFHFNFSQQFANFCIFSSFAHHIVRLRIKLTLKTFSALWHFGCMCIFAAELIVCLWKYFKSTLICSGVHLTSNPTVWISDLILFHSLAGCCFFVCPRRTRFFAFLWKFFSFSLLVLNSLRSYCIFCLFYPHIHVRKQCVWGTRAPYVYLRTRKTKNEDDNATMQIHYVRDNIFWLGWFFFHPLCRFSVLTKNKKTATKTTEKECVYNQYLCTTHSWQMHKMRALRQRKKERDFFYTNVEHSLLVHKIIDSPIALRISATRNSFL